MSTATYRDAIRAEITPARVAAWRPEHPHADIVDFVSDHDCWHLLRADRHSLGPADADRALTLACRYLRFLQTATKETVA